jgi:putative ABC transport system permease protein
MDSPQAHLKFTLRRLRRAPLFTAITLLTLAVGIGANTAIFSVVNGVLLKALPYPDPGALVGVWQTAPGLGFDNLNASPATYFTYREEGRSFDDIGLWQSWSTTVTGLAEPERVDTLAVTDAVLPLLAIQPLHGRLFVPDDDQPHHAQTVILSYGYWQRRFGSDPAAIGRSLTINGRPCEIIGVMPESFRFLDRHPDLFLPLQLDRNDVFVGNFSYQALARLKPGVTIEQANADVARMLPMQLDKFRMAPGISVQMFEDAHLGPNVRPLKQDVVGDIGKILWVLMAAVGIVLFIACANVANLLLVKAEGRQQEFAIRAALGASWPAIARELLYETLTLGLIGGALGVGLAYAGLRLLVYLSPANLPRLDQIAIDPPALLFAVAISLLCGLLFGLVPVFKHARPRLSAALRGGSRTFSEGRERHRTQRALVVVQVALALVLLAGSGLMIRTFQALRRVQPGFSNPEQILTLRISIPDAEVPQPERVARIENEILDKISAIPGVSSAALSNSVTMDGGNNNDPVWVEDQAGSGTKLPPVRRYKHLSPGYFQTLGNPILVGRDFTWTDIHEMRPVVIVSENFASEYWKQPAAALGKRIRETTTGTWREIIGVVGPEHDNGVAQKAPAIVYWPLLKANFWGDRVDVQRGPAVLIRSSRTGTESFFQEVRKAVWSVNSSLPLANVQTVQEIYNHSMARTSFTLVMLAIAASMALLLGVVGIYGVISYSITRRTREIGIRIALGASQEKVRAMFLRQGLLLAGLGVAAGIAAAVPLTRLMSALLYEVSPLDPMTYGGVSLAIVAACQLATYIPARRATRVEPVEALRVE